MVKFAGVTQPGEVRRAFPPNEDGETPTEIGFFDSVAREPARLSGDRVRLYVLNVAANRHPLYGDASENDGSKYGSTTYEFPATVLYDRPDDISTEPTPAGKKKEREAMMHVARIELEELGAPEPKAGDVVEFWGYAPFGDDYRHSFWDVVGSDPSGEHWTQPTFTHMRFKLRWRERFLAERKTRNGAP